MTSRSRHILFLLLVVPGLLPAGSRRPLRAREGMVVSEDSLASAAGREVLRRGGNAVDAAVAVGFTLAVTYPEAGNIGGGGFMVIRMAGGEATMIDFREKAPAAATSDMYLDRAGNPIVEKSLLGPLAAGVPGTVDGLLTALDEYGTMGREELLGRAIALAQEGFPVTERLAASLTAEISRFAGFRSTIRAFTHNGRPYAAGDTLRQRDLASTLREVMERGTDGFYAGPVADRIVAEMRRYGGIMTAEDLRRYRASERDPLVGSYRGYDLVTAAPPSAGGVILLEILNFLEPFDLREMGWNSSRAVHTLAAACRRAFADRVRYMGDPDFVASPVDTLISKAYALSRLAGFDSLRAPHMSGGTVDDHHTTNYCVVDRFGNAVSVTVTLNDLFGCKTVVEGAGFFLNNEMDDFTVKPGSMDMFSLVGGIPNRIEPEKRMLSSMTPTIVLKDNRPYLLLGARGGSKIPTAVAQIICNLIDFGMNIQEAVDAPRVHYQGLPDTLYYEKRALQADVLRALGSMGYGLKEIEETACAQAIMLDTKGGWMLGGADPREDGVALGY